ncbi:hypothetical protein BU26DRAFT_517054 [Trematosphaeria pertusa]|uniref:Uncharacterized protein n=1 Tax=Trematosphaeria pertusa TaxID=390896 RepID=A0A6A6ISB5_9PLEO|nr:uncharacterized protein BU26DRAFT_517054 [Trematosphaeria pertusa]KAF2252423.1 hypothetical protein BU26DRAFT_517054 [Trematosphaeria pertusa]
MSSPAPRPTPIMTGIDMSESGGAPPDESPQADTFLTPGPSTCASGNQSTPTTTSPDTPMTDNWDYKNINTPGSSELSSEKEIELSDHESNPSGMEPKGVVSSEATVGRTTGEVETGRKHTITPPEQGHEKRAKVNAVEPELDEEGIIKLPFQTIKSIRMPPRDGTSPPDPNSSPYGPTENHQNSMIIYWLDEQDKSYTEATRLFGEMFPRSKAVEEAIRRRHIRALQRLARKYGVKPLEEIQGPIGKNTLRRGKKRALKVSKIDGEANKERVKLNITAADPVRNVGGVREMAAQDTQVAQDDISQPKYARNTASYLGQGHKVIEKAAIVVWKDLEGLDFRDIRDRLDDKYHWSLGRGTVEKYYHLTRSKVYGAILEAAPYHEGGDQRGEATMKPKPDGAGDDTGEATVSTRFPAAKVHRRRPF